MSIPCPVAHTGQFSSVTTFMFRASLTIKIMTAVQTFRIGLCSIAIMIAIYRRVIVVITVDRSRSLKFMITIIYWPAHCRPIAAVQCGRPSAGNAVSAFTNLLSLVRVAGECRRADGVRCDQHWCLPYAFCREGLHCVGGLLQAYNTVRRQQLSDYTHGHGRCPLLVNEEKEQSCSCQLMAW